ncbi:unnamed protein product, partial [Enterobius vermicularis]|uniref:ANK_REP_REGION domain-containing protein n=1 Tax=Enterobius vermicularis TaxID=51028 RepID=A0A0N4VKZ6_ENTVE
MEFYYIEELCEHSRKGDLVSIGRLLNEHKELKEGRIKEAMERALSVATECGHLEIVRFFVKYGVNITRKDESSLLFKAASSGNVELVKYLVSSGCDTALKDGYQQTPMHLAAANGHTETVKILAEMGA